MTDEALAVRAEGAVAPSENHQKNTMLAKVTVELN